MTAALVLLAVPGAAADAGANHDAELRMASAINEVRAQQGLHALRGSRSLTRSAGRYSHWLMEHDVFGHSESIRASTRFALRGEALAMHPGRRFDVRGTLSRWLGSPSHSALVLSPVMRKLGVGVTRGRMGSTRATVWVLHTGRLHPPGAGVSPPSLPSLP